MAVTAEVTHPSSEFLNTVQYKYSTCTCTCALEKQMLYIIVQYYCTCTATYKHCTTRVQYSSAVLCTVLYVLASYCSRQKTPLMMRVSRVSQLPPQANTYLYSTVRSYNTPRYPLHTVQVRTVPSSAGSELNPPYYHRTCDDLASYK
jgi:hypothetical protein